MKKPTFAEIAVERAARMAKQTKTIPITKDKTFEQIAEDQSRDHMAWLQVFQALHFLEENPLVNVSPMALDFVRVVRELARTGSYTDGVEQALEPLDTLLPMGRFAAPFKEHADRERRPGPVRAWIKKYMAKHHDHKPAQAWEAFKKRPPKGCSVSGSNIWTDGAGNTSRAWFGTMVGQERPKK